jgi:hypothetical protein
MNFQSIKAHLRLLVNISAHLYIYIYIYEIKNVATFFDNIYIIFSSTFSKMLQHFWDHHFWSFFSLSSGTGGGGTPAGRGTTRAQWS